MGPITLPNLTGVQYLSMMAALSSLEHLTKTQPDVIDGALMAAYWTEDERASVLNAKGIKGLIIHLEEGSRRQADA